uniref:BTB domain-containing protein n=1 Tax=Caenorhabditis tropicalis TaxID=1561998 RepID=A0A1I7T5D5_9PELO
MCSPDDTVKLNVGGTIFQSTHFTLTKFNGYFRKMLESGDTVEKNRFGYIFIDRDPTHFRLILNFMRDGDVDLPESENEIREILREAEFYSLDRLLEMCRVKLGKQIPKKLRILESYDQVLQVISYPRKPVIVIYFFPHSFDGTIHIPFNYLEFIRKNEEDFDIYFKRLEYNTPLPNSHLALWQYRFYYLDESFSGESRDFGKKLDSAVESFKQIFKK